MFIQIVAMLLVAVSGAQAPAESGSAQQPGVELRREVWPDGTLRIERSVRIATADAQGEGGGEVAHGRYVRFHEGGQTAAEGAYTDGLLDGPWTTYWPDGTVRTRGDYLAGRRAGKWKSWHENGQLASTGRYRLGMRDRKWVYLTPDGKKIEAESGLYRTEMQLYESRNRRFLAESKDGQLHGRWVSWWDNGRLQLEGQYRGGVRHGGWSLWHMDGSLEPELVTGDYRDGERVEAPAGALVHNAFELPEELEQSVANAPDPSQLPPLARLPWVKPSQRTGFQEKVERYLDHADEMQRRMAEQLLLQYGRDALPELLNHLARLDLDDPADRARAERVGRLLRGVCKGRGYRLGAEAGAARLAVARWFTWFELARLQDDWWEALRGNAVPAELISTELIDGLNAEEAEEEDQRPELLEVLDTEIKPKLSMLFRQRQRATRPREIRDPIERGLDWLAAHQGLDGGWDCDGFEVECARRNFTVCEGPGLQPHDVGATAFALLAFMGEGNTTHAGDHSDAVLRGLRWLLSKQDPGTGLIGSPQGHALTYNHAVATLALCEAASFTNSPAVRVPARRAVDLILRAQTPGSGWHYSLVPDGTADTSVTGWMVRALFAAREAELEVDSGAFEGALAWIDQVTDSTNGRVGYDIRGSHSSRVEDINAHFPVDTGEAMTAAGLFSRFLIGQDPEDVAIMGRHADLMLRSLPVWAPEDYGCDLYYWAQGTEAMAQMGGTYWKAWRASLWRALIGSQEPGTQGAGGRCLGGSWDPVGPWGYAGGRVYATALALLCLQGEHRNPKLTR